VEGGDFAPDDADGMQERELIGIDVRLERRLVHQTAHRKVGHHQSVELLPDQVWSFAAQDDLGATQVGFQFGQGRFDPPALVIEGGEFSGRRRHGVEQTGQQSIDGLGLGHPLQAVLDDAHGDAVALRLK
jgi:hypothetical protein